MKTHTTVHASDAIEGRQIYDTLTALLGEPQVSEYTVGTAGARQAHAEWQAGTHAFSLIASTAHLPAVYAMLTSAAAPPPWDMTPADAHGEANDA